MDIPVQDGSNTTASESKIYPFSFQGNGGTLFGIQIVNLLLIIVTLGIYYFWAKTRVRVYTWSQTDFNGDRFAYHGTGKEILLGWLKALVVFGIPFYALQNISLIAAVPMPFKIAGFLISYLIISLFIPVATVGSRRYRLSRTSLRGIRFSFRGRWYEFAKIFFACIPWLILTLGFYMPYLDMRRQTFLIERGYYGNEKFSFDGKGKDLLRSYVLVVLMALPTLFIFLLFKDSGHVRNFIGLMILTLPILYISWLWYSYKKTKYTWNHTSFGTARFQSTITFGGLIGLYLVNGLILIFTLGFGAPWAKVRTLRYYLTYLTLEGKLDLSTIVQEAQDSSAFGEEVGDFLAMDFDLG